MPAVNPVKLRFQIADVIEFFDTPKAFHRELENLFGFYEYRTLRKGGTIQSEPMIPSFHLPNPVLRQLKLDVKSLIISNPQNSFALCDELWQSQYYEIRQVAIHILGTVSAQEPKPILDRLEAWLKPDLDPFLKSELLANGTKSFLSEFPEKWDSFLTKYLDHDNPRMKALGLQGFSEPLKQKTYSNLPTIFRNISPIIQEPEFELVTALRDLFEALIEHSPQETAFFLRQNLSVTDSSLTHRLVKQCLPLFPKTTQEQLKEVLV